MPQARSSPARHRVGRTPKPLAREHLSFVGLAYEAHRPAAALPLPGRKRLELAKSLAMKPRVLLLDEVNAGLNTGEIEHALTLMRAIADRGITILIIEHLMKVVLTLSQRILVLHHGRLDQPRRPADRDPAIRSSSRPISDANSPSVRSDSPMAEPLLRVQNLCAGYGQVQVLWGADLTVERGSIVVPRRVERRGQVHPAARDLRADHSRPAGTCILASATSPDATPDEILSRRHRARARRDGDCSRD